MTAGIITEMMQDFSGGYNSLFAPNRIAPNEAPSMQNVWYDTAALKQRFGSTFVTINPGLSGSTLFFTGVNLYRTFINGSETLFISGNVKSTVSGNSITARSLMYTTNGSTFSRATRNVAGTVTVSASGSTVTGSGTIFRSKVNNGDTIIIGGEANQVTAVNTDTSLNVAGTWSANQTNVAYDVMPAIDETYSPVFLTLNGKLYVTMLNSAYVPFSWDGMTAANNPGMPNAFCGLVYKNYVFLGNQTGKSARLAWSAILDATTFPATNFIDYIPSDGQGIVGVFLDGQGIVILKTNSAFKVVGETFDPSNITYSSSQVFAPSDFQINSAKSVQFYNGAWIMLGRFGMYVYDGSYTISKLPASNNIKSLMTNSGFALGLVPAAATLEPSSIIVNDKYWLAYAQTAGSGGGKRSMLIFDMNSKFWYWLWSDAGAISDMAYLSNTLYGVRNDMASGVYTGFGFMTPGIGSSDPSNIAIAGSWTSKVLQYEQQQSFQLAWVHYKKQASGTLTFGYRFDDSQSFTTVSIDMTSGIGSGQRLKSNPIILGQQSNTIQFQISDNNTGDDFEVYGIEFQRIKGLM